VSKKFIPNGDLDFANKSQSFARTLLKEAERYDVARGDVEELDAAVKKYSAALQAARFGGKSQAATRAKEDARGEAEEIMRRIAHHVRLNKRLDAASKLMLGIRERTARPKVTLCPQEPPRLRFVRALHQAGASPMHELSFTSYDGNRARPEGAVRLELFVDLIAPDEPIPTHPGANHGGRPWYLCSYTRSPIVIAPPMPRVPMRVLYWGRWAGSGSGPGNVGPFSATAAGWIEGGTHGYLPGGLSLRMGNFGRDQQKLIDAEPVLPASREEKYSVAVLEVHYQSFQANPVTAPALEHEQHEQRQLEGPVEESEAA
jgi:hypothetical protein